MTFLGECGIGGRCRGEAKILAEFIESRTKASSTSKTTESTHGVVALRDGTIILLDPIVEVTVGVMQNLAAEHAADGSWITIMPVGGHALWFVADRLDRLFEKGLGCR